MSSAAAEYYTSLEEGVTGGETDHREDLQLEDSDDETHAAPPAQTGGRTLGGASFPQPIPTTSSAPAPSSIKAPQKKFATLGDFQGGAHSGHGHDDEDDSDYDEKQDLFAGGEKSALAVKNPEDLKKKIITRAKQYVTVSEKPGGKANATNSKEYAATWR